MGKTRTKLPMDPIPFRGVNVEDTLMNALKFSGLDRNHLSELVSIVKNIGLKPVKVFPYGIPVPDGVGIEVSLNAKGLGALVNRLDKIARIDKIDIFPKGIPYPQMFDAQIRIK